MIMFWILVLNAEDSQLIATLYEKYYRLFLFKANSILKDPDLSKDMVQEAMLTLINYIPKLRSLDEPAKVTYCINTLQTTCYLYFRRENKEKAKLLPLLSQSNEPDTPEEILERIELTDQVHTILLRLSVRERWLLRYKYILEYDNEKIGELLDIKTKNVSTYMRRARKRALAEYKKQFNEIEGTE